MNISELVKFIGIIITSIVIGGCMSAAITSAGVIYDRHELTEVITDTSLAQRANVILGRYPELRKNTNIKAYAFNRMILLTGKARSKDILKKAETVISSIPKVRYLMNKVDISQNLDHQSFLQDLWITTQLKTKIIFKARVDPNDVKVVTADKIVYLLGTVRRKQAYQLAEIARHIKGVKKVVLAFEYIETPLKKTMIHEHHNARLS